MVAEELEGNYIVYRLKKDFIISQPLSFLVVSCPSDALALTNKLILNPQSGFRDGDHVLVKDAFPVTIKYACEY